MAKTTKQDPPKPSQRGVSHGYAATVAPVAGALLTLEGESNKARFGLLVYTLTLTVCFSVSAFYHRPNWDVKRRKLMKRLDHSAIYLLIAGTYTPLCLLAMGDEDIGKTLLLMVWSGAGAGVIKSLVFPNAPKWLSALIYVGLGATALPYWHVTSAALGPVCSALVIAGGVLFAVGAVVYAAHWPDPHPNHFGYHELFHVFVILAASLHYIALWRVVHGLHLT